MSFEVMSESEPWSFAMEEKLKAAAIERAPSEVATIAAASTADELFYALSAASLAAFRLDQFSYARELAEKNLKMALNYQSDWNYGNAIHSAHSVFGLLALSDGNAHEAIDELYKSGDTPGSPQLNSFGPSMELAKALLRAGKLQEVLIYFNQCRKFWSRGHVWLEVWEQKVRNGRVPNFVMHSHR